MGPFVGRALELLRPGRVEGDPRLGAARAGSLQEPRGSDVNTGSSGRDAALVFLRARHDPK